MIGIGQVSGGHICLRGWLQRITLHSDQIKDKQRIFGVQEFTINIDAPYIPESKWVEWFCLPILKFKNALGDSDIKGLVLEENRNHNEDKRYYQRVGIFSTNENGFEYFKRPTYPATSEYPTDGTTTASVSEILSEVGTDGSLDQKVAAEQAANARELREKQRKTERLWEMNVIDTRVGWVESIITII